VLAYAVVSAETDKAVGLFVRREQAERFLEDVRADEPELAERLRLEAVELED
jgi:Tic22-like family protein